MPETILIHCPRCGTEFELAPEYLGHRLACPACEARFMVDEHGAVIDAPAAEVPPAPETPAAEPPPAKRVIHVSADGADAAGAPPPRRKSDLGAVAVFLVFVSALGALVWAYRTGRFAALFEPAADSAPAVLPATEEIHPLGNDAPAPVPAAVTPPAPKSVPAPAPVPAPKPAPVTVPEPAPAPAPVPAAVPPPAPEPVPAPAAVPPPPAPEPSPVAGKVGGSAETVRSGAAEADLWAPERPRPEAPLGVLEASTSDEEKRRAAVRRGPDAVDFTRDSAETIRTRSGLAARGAGGRVPEHPSAALALALVRAHILDSVGASNVQAVVALEGGADFANAFFNDLDWMDAFAASGPWKTAPGEAFRLLSELVWNDADNWILATSVGRDCATAIALDSNAADVEGAVRRLQAFERFARLGRLHESAYALDCREWRYVILHGVDATEMRILNENSNQRYDNYGGMCWQVPYRSYNCFGDTVQGPLYYMPWSHAWAWAKTAPRVGGVCGSLSTFGSRSADAHGQMAVTGGQPGHCAYMMRGRDGQWRIHYYVERFTGAHWGLLGGNFQYHDIAEQVFKNPHALAAARNRWLAGIIRDASQNRAAGAKPSRNFRMDVDKAYRAAVETLPCDLVAWREYRDWLLAVDAPEQVWDRYGRDAALGLKDAPEGAWEVLAAWFDHVKKAKGKPGLLLALSAAHRVLRQPTRTIAEPYNFQAALNSDAARLDRDLPLLAKLFEVVAQAQLDTPDYFGMTISWGASLFMSDAKASTVFLATLSHLAATASDARAAAKGRKKGPGFDVNDLIRRAAESGNIAGFHDAAALQQKLYPPPKPAAARKTAKTAGKTAAEEDDPRARRRFPRTDFGGSLVSEKGLVRPSTEAKRGVRPDLWPRLIDDSPVTDGFIETGDEKAPWVEVMLPGAAQVSGVYVQNAGALMGVYQVPLVITASEDRKTWHNVYSNELAASSWRADLSRNPVRAQYVRVGRAPDATNALFRVTKVLVYGRKLY